MKKLLYIYNYFIYRLKAVNEHGIHSPFVFDLLTNVIYNRNDYYCFKKIEIVREQLHHTKSVKYSQLLFRLVNHFQPPQIIELGTSFGISTLYMASASSKLDVITIEENLEMAAIAERKFKQLKLKNIEQKTGSIDAVLPVILTKHQNLYFIYFNTNHCKQATLNYFYQCLEKANEASIFVFDDMYCSSEMKDTWNEIKNNNRVTVTIDLFFMGIVFFRKEQVKQHFVIKY